jgi:hypothetical protein
LLGSSKVRARCASIRPKSLTTLLLKGLLGSRSLKPTIGLALPESKGLIATEGLIVSKGIALSCIPSSKNIVYKDFAADHVNRFLFEFNIVLRNRSHNEFRQDVAR